MVKAYLTMEYIRSAVLRSAVVIALIGVILVAHGIEHVSMHSLFPPILADYWDTHLHFWSFGTSTVITDQLVRLTTRDPTARGYLWNRHANRLGAFEANFTFQMRKRSSAWFSDTSDSGIALWYTLVASRHTPLSFYGGNPSFDGLGVILDHSDTISVLVNTGEAVKTVHTSKRVGQCTVRGLNEHLITILVRYDNETKTLTVSYVKFNEEHKPHETRYLALAREPCVTATVSLPLMYFFGVTAVNSPTSTAEHDLHSFFVKSIHANDKTAEREDERVGLHLFSVKAEKALQKEWEGKGDEDPAKDGVTTAAQRTDAEDAPV